MRQLAASQLQDQLAAALGHDRRSPLSAIAPAGRRISRGVGRTITRRTCSTR